LAVRAGGVFSNFSSIAIASSGPVCSDAIGFSTAHLEKLRAGQLRISELSLKKTTYVDLKGTQDVVGFLSHRYPSDLALAAVRLGRQPFDAPSSHVPYGACTVSSGRLSTALFEIPGDVATPPRLRGGVSLNVQGPLGAKQIPRRGGNDDFYATAVGGGIPGFTGDAGPEYLVPAVYTIDNPAGPDVGALTATLTLPAPIVWTNSASFSVVRRSEDLTLTWTGGDAGKEFVEVSVGSWDTTRQVAAGISCTERASAGRFTIPASLLSTLPPSSGVVPGTSYPYGAVRFSVYSIVEPARFQASGIDVGYAGYGLINWKLAAIQYTGLEQRRHHGCDYRFESLVGDAGVRWGHTPRRLKPLNSRSATARTLLQKLWQSNAGKRAKMSTQT
jgi:hypothetical protein